MGGCRDRGTPRNFTVYVHLHHRKENRIALEYLPMFFSFSFDFDWGGQPIVYSGACLPRSSFYLLNRYSSNLPPSQVYLFLSMNIRLSVSFTVQLTYADHTPRVPKHMPETAPEVDDEPR